MERQIDERRMGNGKIDVPSEHIPTITDDEDDELLGAFEEEDEQLDDLDIEDDDQS